MELKLNSMEINFFHNDTISILGFPFQEGFYQMVDLRFCRDRDKNGNATEFGGQNFWIKENKRNSNRR